MPKAVRELCLWQTVARGNFADKAHRKEGCLR
jgi:hypothetical protein